MISRQLAINPDICSCQQRNTWVPKKVCKFW